MDTTYGLKLDWLEFTYKFEDGFEGDGWRDFELRFPELHEIIYSEKTYLLEKGRLGYSSVLCFSDCMSFWYNAEQLHMGVHVQVSGSGLATFARCFGFDIVDGTDCLVYAFDLIRLLDSRGCVPSRFDIAFDDYQKVFSPNDIFNLKKEGRVRCYSRKWAYYGSEDNKGESIYFGLRSSGRMLRIYDKDYESRGRIPAIRWEIELRHNWAKRIWKCIAEDTNINFVDILFDFCELLEYYSLDGTDHELECRKNRAKRLKEFEDLFIRKRLVLRKDLFVSVKNDVTPLEDRLYYYEKTFPVMLYEMKCVLTTSEFNRLIKIGEARADDARKALIKEYQSQKGYVNMKSFFEDY